MKATRTNPKSRVATTKPRTPKRAKARPTPEKPTKPRSAQRAAGIEVPQTFRAVAKAFAEASGVTLEKGWGSGNIVLKQNGKMFVMLIGADLVAKLPRERVDELVASAAGERFDPRRNGKVMKEWVVVAKRTRWLTLAREAHAFALA